MTGVDSIGLQPFGRSSQRRLLWLRTFGPHDAARRLLVVAGQHGDEPLARKAAVRLMGLLSKDGWTRGVSVAVVADANPDGKMAGTRCNAQEIDLNRDHLELRSPENQALHQWIDRWRPHVIADLHTYPARRRVLRRHGLRWAQDVFADFATHPALRWPFLPPPEQCLEEVLQPLRSNGFLCGRYTLARPSGRIRHSTPDIVNLRNCAALRSRAFSWIVEGRQPTAGEPAAAKRRCIVGLVEAVLSILKWMSALDPQHLLAQPALPGDLVPVSCRYMRSDQPCRMPFWDDRQKRIVEAELPGRFTPDLKVAKQIRLPAAYAIPCRLKRALHLLKRHGFESRVSCQETLCRIERYFIEEPGRSRNPNRLGKPRVSLSQACEPFHEFRVFPTDADRGLALAILLEPESKYGVARLDGCELKADRPGPYSVVRIP